MSDCPNLTQSHQRDFDQLRQSHIAFGEEPSPTDYEFNDFASTAPKTKSNLLSASPSIPRTQYNEPSYSSPQPHTTNNSSLQGSLRLSSVTKLALENLDTFNGLMNSSLGYSSLTISQEERFDVNLGSLKSIKSMVKTLIDANLDNEEIIENLLHLNDNIELALKKYDRRHEDDDNSHKEPKNDRDDDDDDNNNDSDDDEKENDIKNEVKNDTKKDVKNETVTTTTTTPIAINKNLGECMICYSEEPLVELCTYHRYCKTCTEQHLETLIKDGRVFAMNCPGFKQCGRTYTDVQVSEHTSAELFKKYLSFRFVSALEKDPNNKWCPKPDCNTPIAVTDPKAPPHLTCPVCTYEFCYKCGKEWHEGKCKKEKLDKKNERWKGKKTKACPKCQVRIEKNSGCAHMTCRHCRHEFCWNCGADYQTHGTCLSKAQIVACVAAGTVIVTLAVPVGLIALPIYGGYRLKRKLFN
eukprot:TRINITY_DN11720_c0_g1_i1.p1 TRINITY_DN11720_c0_g1~~TRINITY_DN11720_c0_g1_i1.p1  ORF type:complete len:468 (+),score=80.61 TRINITY_DN11720_c0_g1_i1:50-1453(+)